jgi:hypothetical protein
MRSLRSVLCVAAIFLTTGALAADLPIKPPRHSHRDRPNSTPNRLPPLTPPPGVKALGVFPPLAPGQTEYTVTAPDAVLYIQKLYIPKGVTIKVAPDVTSIDWAVQEFIFEQDATIDLATGAGKAARGSDGSGPPQQAPYCKPGASGHPGNAGGTGQPGVSLTIRDLWRVTNKGSLWIRTDGAAGGDGGSGGQGQQGGGHDKRGVIGHCDAANGGSGGSGGPGGAGGPTSSITLSLHDVQNVPHNAIKAGCATVCTPSTRPPGATGDTGVIAVWGSPGCGGNGGPGGPGGLEGDKGEAVPGGTGSAGGAGSLGSCTAVNSWH